MPPTLSEGSAEGGGAEAGTIEAGAASPALASVTADRYVPYVERFTVRAPRPERFRVRQDVEEE